MRILLTGFEPFGGETTNPSWQAVQRAAELWTRPESIAVVEVPVEFARASGVLLAAMREHEPDLVIAVGQAGGIRDLHIERVAINVQDARIPDNAGEQPIDVPVVPTAGAAYFSTLPIKAVTAAITARGIPASVSQSAGTFVCNHVFFELMHATAGTPVRGGFVHVPFAPGQAGVVVPDGVNHPTMEVETMADALLVILEESIDHPFDVVLSGGTIF